MAKRTEPRPLMCDPQHAQERSTREQMIVKRPLWSGVAPQHEQGLAAEPITLWVTLKFWALL